MQHDFNYMATRHSVKKKGQTFYGSIRVSKTERLRIVAPFPVFMRLVKYAFAQKKKGAA